MCWRFSVPTQTIVSPVVRHQRALEEVPHVGEQIAPLGGENVNEVHTFGLAFQNGRSGWQEMYVHIGSGPALRPETHQPGNLQGEFALMGRDRDLLPLRLIFESLGYFHKDFPYRQLNLKVAVDIGKGGVHQLDVSAVILEPSIVHFGTVATRRDVSTFLGPEGYADGSRAPRGSV